MTEQTRTPPPTKRVRLVLEDRRDRAKTTLAKFDRRKRENAAQYDSAKAIITELDHIINELTKKGLI